MKVLMLARASLFEVSGGDKIQILKTKEALEARGHQVTLSTRLIEFSDFDVVHLFNMMVSPHTMLVYLLEAKRTGKPVALSTVYWNPKAWREKTPLEWMSSYRKRGGIKYPFPGIPIWKLVLLFAIHKPLREWLKLFLLRRKSGEASTYIKAYLVKNVDIILPNGESEGVEVQKDFGKAKRCLFVPNGVDPSFSSVKPGGFKKLFGLDDFILSVGRLETRKKTLDLIEACEELGLPLVLIGGDAEGEGAYGERLRDAGKKYTTFIEHMPQEQLGSAYASARVHAMVSWFETPGLSSLEAGLAGCNIVTTEVGTTREYFVDLAWYTNPEEPRSVKQALREAWGAPKNDKLKRHLLEHFTWEKVAAKTEKGYEAIIK